MRLARERGRRDEPVALEPRRHEAIGGVAVAEPAPLAAAPRPHAAGVVERHRVEAAGADRRDGDAGERRDLGGELELRAVAVAEAAGAVEKGAAEAGRVHLVSGGGGGWAGGRAA